jgi:hypothetical protein
MKNQPKNDKEEEALIFCDKCGEEIGEHLFGDEFVAYCKYCNRTNL